MSLKTIMGSSNLQLNFLCEVYVMDLGLLSLEK